MILLTMTVPDDPAELSRWLEQRLVAADFAQFIAELSAHFPVASSAEQPLDLLDRWLPVALDEGLTPLPPEVLSQLLRHPSVLAKFQEHVVIEGGAYWDDLIDATDSFSEHLERGRSSLQRAIAEDNQADGKVRRKAALKAVPAEAVKRPSGRGYKAWAIVSTAIAACLVVAVVWQAIVPEQPTLPKAKIAWGWARPGGLAADESSPKAYLNKLADNAEEWSAYRPGDSNGVATRIAEMRLGCAQLMHSNYGPLNPADKEWLLEHCREWAKALDRHQQALDAGAEAVTVRGQVDETVREIAATLREKAKQVG